MDTPFRVLLIDDDADLRKLIKLTLEFTAGWEVATAGDGAAGLEEARRQKPDVIVLDVMMPVMDGYEVCRRLKQDPALAAIPVVLLVCRRLKQDPALAAIPVVLLTARKEQDEERLRTSGAAGVVLKPFDPEGLAARIRELVG